MDVSQKSNRVLAELGPQIQWVHSYVTQDKMTCVYLAPNVDMVRQHAGRGGFPADRVDEVLFIVDPLTADGALWTTKP